MVRARGPAWRTDFIVARPEGVNSEWGRRCSASRRPSARSSFPSRRPWVKSGDTDPHGIFTSDPHGCLVLEPAVRIALHDAVTIRVAAVADVPGMRRLP